MMEKKKHLPGLLLLILVVAGIWMIFRARLKSWLIIGLMAAGFFRPEIPASRPNGPQEPAPDLQLHDAAGRRTELDRLKGKVVFINFWATWCAPCLAEIPSISRLYERLKTNPDIVFIMADVDNQPARSSAFLQRRGFSLPVYAAPGARSLYDQGIPTTLVIDRQGNIVFRHFNRANCDTDEFQRYLEGLSRK